jgi:hypothetical protein
MAKKMKNKDLNRNFIGVLLANTLLAQKGQWI